MLLKQYVDRASILSDPSNSADITCSAFKPSSISILCNAFQMECTSYPATTDGDIAKSCGSLGLVQANVFVYLVFTLL